MPCVVVCIPCAHIRLEDESLRMENPPPPVKVMEKLGCKNVDQIVAFYPASASKCRRREYETSLSGQAADTEQRL